MARKKATSDVTSEPAAGVGHNNPPPPNVWAAAIAEITANEFEMASLAGRKAAIFNRYEAQGVDRKILKATVALSRMDQDKAAAYLRGLTQAAVAVEVIRVADAGWTASVQQADLFAPADGEDADNLRFARARKQGFAAGKKGHVAQANPYTHNIDSPEAVGWAQGHVEGKNIRELIKPGAKNVSHITAGKGRRKAATPPAEDVVIAPDIEGGISMEDAMRASLEKMAADVETAEAGI